MSSSETQYNPEKGLDDYLSDPAVSHWLKHALVTQAKRDPVDALNDTLELCGYLQKKLDWLIAQKS